LLTVMVSGWSGSNHAVSYHPQYLNTQRQISLHSAGRSRRTGDFYILEFSAPKRRARVAHVSKQQYVAAARIRNSNFVENRLHAT